MTIEVELYRAPGYEPAGRRPLAPLLREASSRSWAAAVRGPVPAASGGGRRPAADPRAPTLVNLRGSHGYMQVTIVEDGEVTYEQPDSVAEMWPGRCNGGWPPSTGGGALGFGLVGPASKS